MPRRIPTREDGCARLPPGRRGKLSWRDIADQRHKLWNEARAIYENPNSTQADLDRARRMESQMEKMACDIAALTGLERMDDLERSGPLGRTRPIIPANSAAVWGEPQNRTSLITEEGEERMSPLHPAVHDSLTRQFDRLKQRGAFGVAGTDQYGEAFYR